MIFMVPYFPGIFDFLTSVDRFCMSLQPGGSPTCVPAKATSLKSVQLAGFLIDTVMGERKVVL